ncbi:MAG TPA: hypothetical protein VF733_00015 [Candidatus Saccharimonadales bacterium]
MQRSSDIPYQLLGHLDPASPLQGLSDKEISNTAQAVTTAYITTMYYSALSNLYLQSILPPTMAEVEAQMPRVKIALERSFRDFAQAASWLTAHNELINTSPAKEYYHEVMGLEQGAVKNMTTFYASEDQ